MVPEILSLLRSEKLPFDLQDPANPDQNSCGLKKTFRNVLYLNQIKKMSLTLEIMFKPFPGVAAL